MAGITVILMKNESCPKQECRWYWKGRSDYDSLGNISGDKSRLKNPCDNCSRILNASDKYMPIRDPK